MKIKLKYLILLIYFLIIPPLLIASAHAFSPIMIRGNG